MEDTNLPSPSMENSNLPSPSMGEGHSIQPFPSPPMEDTNLPSPSMMRVIPPTSTSTPHAPA